MTEVFGIVRESMKAGGVPAPLITSAEQPWADATVQAKITTAYSIMETKPLLLVVGAESPKKELICAKIMRKFMLTRNKNGLWLSPAKVPLTSFKEDTLPHRGVTVIIGMEMLLAFQLSVVTQLLRDRLPAGAAFIISVSSDKSFNGLVGATAGDYFSHYAAILEIDSKPAEIIKV